MKNNAIFKQREGTVFSYKIFLKKQNLTKQGYFDLKKIKNLRILDNGFLKIIRKIYNKTQKDISLMASVPLRTEIGWESYKKALPFNKLIKICEKLNLSAKEVYELIKNSEFTFGNHHGKNRVRLPLKPEEFDIDKYLTPIKPNKVYVIKNTPSKIKEKIIREFSIDDYYLDKSGLLVIYSYLLHNFLKTFYGYKKELLLKFPLTDEIPYWMKKKINIIKSVLIPLLLTDGGEKPSGLFCSGESDIVHSLFTDSFYYEFNKLPSSFKLSYKTIFITNYRLFKDDIDVIKKFCLNFKTAPRNELKAEYLNLSQPTISYLLERPRLEQQIALRLWAITEGSISIHNSKREKLITPNFRIACAHPNLTEELRILARFNGINMSIKKSNSTWSGIGGLQTSSIKSVINFLKIGGFIRGVRVVKSRSKVFGGFDKQDVLLGVLEFMKKQRKQSIYRTSNIQKINKWIRDIIRNKEFENEQYYIKYFQKE